MNSELHALIKQAFLAAKKKNVPAWYRMNAGVLKNRMILLTNGQFNEENYGYQNFRELVEANQTFLNFDTSTRPATVELTDQSFEIGEDLDSQGTKRLRPDLWRAVTDYASGRTYVWDTQQNLARVVTEGATESFKILPTINSVELSQWRNEFISKHKDRVVGPDLEKANRWEAEGLAIAFLPSSLRQYWAQEFSENVLERLLAWFRENSITPPLLDMAPERTVQRPSTCDALRLLVIQCVEVMTQRELEQLQLPASLLTRIKLAK